MKTNRPALLALSLALSLVLLAGCRGATRLETLWDAPHFGLTDETGQPFSSDALAGRVWLADFIYTNCPDECPIYLTPKMMALQKEIIARNLVGEAQLISFTVDPQRDTPQVLAAYGANVGADPRVWRFLTGPNATVQPMLQTGFKVGSALPADSITAGHGTPGSATPAAAGENANHLLVHSSYFVLVDGQGKIRAVYDGELIEATEMLKGIQALLDER